MDELKTSGRRRCIARHRGGTEDRGFEFYPISGTRRRTGCSSSGYGGHRTPDVLMRTRTVRIGGLAIRVGTKNILFGVHNFVIHTALLAVAVDSFQQ